MKDHTIKKLIEALRESGRITAKTYLGARQVLGYWIRTGKLVLRKRAFTGYYLVNDKEIEEIVKAFSYGGEGFYHAQLENEN